MKVQLFLILALLQPIFSSGAFAQTNAGAPLSYKRVQEFWDAERLEPRNSSLRGITSQAVLTRGVLFEVDFRREEEMTKAGMPATLINLIKMNLKGGTIEIQCEPVEC